MAKRTQMTILVFCKTYHWQEGTQVELNFNAALETADIITVETKQTKKTWVNDRQRLFTFTTINLMSK